MLSTTFINTSWQNDYPAILHLTKGEPVLESSSVPIQTSLGIVFKVQYNSSWCTARLCFPLQNVCTKRKKTPVNLCMFCEVLLLSNVFLLIVSLKNSVQRAQGARRSLYQCCCIDTLML